MPHQKAQPDAQLTDDIRHVAAWLADIVATGHPDMGRFAGAQWANAVAKAVASGADYTVIAMDYAWQVERHLDFSAAERISGLAHQRAASMSWPLALTSGLLVQRGLINRADAANAHNQLVQLAQDKIANKNTPADTIRGWQIWGQFLSGMLYIISDPAPNYGQSMAAVDAIPTGDGVALLGKLHLGVYGEDFLLRWGGTWLRYVSRPDKMRGLVAWIAERLSPAWLADQITSGKPEHVHHPAILCTAYRRIALGQWGVRDVRTLRQVVAEALQRDDQTEQAAPQKTALKALQAMIALAQEGITRDTKRWLADVGDALRMFVAQSDARQAAAWLPPKAFVRNYGHLLYEAGWTRQTRDCDANCSIDAVALAVRDFACSLLSVDAMPASERRRLLDGLHHTLSLLLKPHIRPSAVHSDDSDVAFYLLEIAVFALDTIYKTQDARHADFADVISEVEETALALLDMASSMDTSSGERRLAGGFALARHPRTIAALAKTALHTPYLRMDFARHLLKSGAAMRFWPYLMAADWSESPMNIRDFLMGLGAEEDTGAMLEALALSPDPLPSPEVADGVLDALQKAGEYGELIGRDQMVMRLVDKIRPLVAPYDRRFAEWERYAAFMRGHNGEWRSARGAPKGAEGHADTGTAAKNKGTPQECPSVRWPTAHY